MTIRGLLDTIDNKEWRTVILISVIVVVITTIPYIYGYFSAPEGMVYTGAHAISSGDFPVYFSYIQQVKEGAWLIRDQFTSEFQDRGVLNLFWLEVGLSARVFHLPAIIVFRIYGVILIPVALVVLYLFISYFFQDKVRRFIAFLLGSFGSGIGVYFSQIIDPIIKNGTYTWPTDLWVAESNIFLSMFQSPHFILSWVLMMGVFLLFLLAIDNRKYRYSIAGGALALYWFNFHPFYFPYAVIILAAFSLFMLIYKKRWDVAVHGAIITILGVPFVVYHYWIISSSALHAGKAVQNILITPPFQYLLLGFGMLLVLGIAGMIVHLFKDKIFDSCKWVFLVFWGIGGFALLYSPFFFQRRFMEGIQIPLVIFSAIALFEISIWIKKRYPGFGKFLREYPVIFILVAIMIFGMSSVGMITRDLILYTEHNRLFLIPEDYIPAVHWIDENNQSSLAILSHPLAGNRIPGYVNQRVFVGHFVETVDFERKKQEATDYFTDNFTMGTAEEWLKNANIGYILYGPYEKGDKLFEIDTQQYLSKIYEVGEVEVYEVIGARGSIGE